MAHSNSAINESTPPTDFEIYGFIVLADHLKEDAPMLEKIIALPTVII